MDDSQRPDLRWGQLQWLISLCILNLGALAIETMQTDDLFLVIVLRLMVVTPMILVGIVVNRCSTNRTLKAISSAAPLLAFSIWRAPICRKP